VDVDALRLQVTEGLLHQIAHAKNAQHKTLQVLAALFERVDRLALDVHRQEHQEAELPPPLLYERYAGGGDRVARVPSRLDGL
jgi:hypothetical protein